MSQNVDIGPSLRHGTLCLNVFYKCVKCYGWEMNLEGYSLVHKIEVKK